MKIFYLLLFTSWLSSAQDGISITKVVEADFDENGFEDIAYFTQEKTADYDSIQIEVYFKNYDGSESEIKTEKIIFNKTRFGADTENLICYSFTFSENNLCLIFKKNNTNYYWFFNYYNQDFELLYYGESVNENETQKHRMLNLRESKLTISVLKTGANDWNSYSHPHTVVAIPTLNNFKGFEVKWPK
jgi:hypothetical protein